MRTGAALLVFAMLASFATAQDDEPQEREVEVRLSSQGLLSVGAAALGADEITKELERGSPVVLQVRVAVHRTGEVADLASRTRQCRIVHDLWERRFRVQADVEGEPMRVMRDVDEVLDACLALDRFSIDDGWPTRTGGSRVWFSIVVELDPPSAEDVHTLRSWLAHPNGYERGRSFFGSIVSMFVIRSVGRAERTMRFRSGEEPAP